jgi:hypothetical protein
LAENGLSKIDFFFLIFIFQGDQLEKLLHWEAVHLRPAVLTVLSGLIQVRLG